MAPDIIHHPATHIACFAIGLAMGAILLPGSIWLADLISEHWNGEG